MNWSRLIGKILDKLLDVLWDFIKGKRKKGKGKSWKQYYKDWREDVKRKQAEYKALPFKTKLKMESKKFGKAMLWMIAIMVVPLLITSVLSSLGWLEPLDQWLYDIGIRTDGEDLWIE